MRRRQVALGATAALAAGGAALYALKRSVLNPCARAADPGHGLDPELMARVWRGLDPARVWDGHVHVAGIGSDPHNGEPWTHPRFTNPLNPFLFVHFALYADASCALRYPGPANQAYVSRLFELAGEFPAGAKFLLYALDGCYRGDGSFDAQRSVLRVPNEHVMRIAQTDPARFEWVASVNPGRAGAADLVRAAARDGARALKWVPYLMDFDPAAAPLNAFYDLLVELKLPLIVHAGWQHPLLEQGNQDFGNPLRLRRALERGVKVVVAHCATQGDFADIDTGQGMTQRSSFELFRRLVDESAHRNLLAGDISGIVDTGRPVELLRELLRHPRWSGRLVNGSDYPLPGARVAVSSAHLVAQGLLDARLPPRVDHIQAHNPLLFDLVLKRSLAYQGKAFASDVFEGAAAWFGGPGRGTA